ncbi:tRNA nucleotidyltransferase (CCA-adding enzyme) [Evansella caseinilytica]|uniref:tRNA nucleotidyltransferase (CCA-adding enzyme) n=1 Tax=Evansella caseinilytica TaxID=1503961 RepID=A0A1H3KCF7_9BACI|nr:CBS domain-containing protein [Evansella caseinilytica]SDY49917.1 tRNA nucleotidyltransferase (CCA-adding enzyme) [Evansella caseinilytica]
MKVIVSHTNLDFDGLASMIGAKKLYPQAEMILPEKLSSEVEHFLAIYKDTFPFKKSKEVNWDHAQQAVLVDVNQLSRTGKLKTKLHRLDAFIIYDHHPITAETVPFTEGDIRSTGAAITLLIEKIQEKSLAVSPFEATVFALGLYSDTGAFTYDQTTAEDLAAAAWCLQKGANLSVIEQYRDIPLKKEQQHLFQLLLDRTETIEEDGIEIVISLHEQQNYTGQLSMITKKLLRFTGADSAFAIVKMEEKVFITARAVSDRINVLPVIRSLGGGGHNKAASAMVKGATAEEMARKIRQQLYEIVAPSITAEHIMSSPVRVVAPDTAIEVVSKMLYRYGHTGFPVVENDWLVGIISRRDVDKALHHGLGHAPVKGYMSRQPITINKNDQLEKIQELMIEEQVGRLPVMENGELLGIVSRTDVIQAMHGNKKHSQNVSGIARVPYKKTIATLLKRQLNPHIYELLTDIGREAEQRNMHVYLIGGMVRDLLLGRANEDIDIVVEGDGILFAEYLQRQYGGHVRSHEAFRTATWKHPCGLKLDLTSARTEYYDFPAALPKVEMSTIKEDLFRRDFTINAMGICLHQSEFGELIDYFHGYQDLLNKQLKVLYNLSFVEDPTRILRALRFESRFGFTMDRQTESLAKESANNLLAVSKPRIANELIRLFLEENPLFAIDRIDDLGILPFLLKNRDSFESMKQKITRLARATATLTENSVPLSRSLWTAYLFCLTPVPATEACWQEVHNFCISKEDHKLLNDLQALIEGASLDKQPLTALSDWHHLFASMQTEPLLTYFSLVAAEQGIDYLLARDHLNNGRKVAGADLIRAGLKPGPDFKQLLLEAEKLQLDKPDLSPETIVKLLADQ